MKNDTTPHHVHIPNTDPDVRRYDRDNDMPVCPECHFYMVPLDSFEIEGNAMTSTDDPDFVEFVIWGWAHYMVKVIANFIYDLFTSKNREDKVARLKREVLPVAPNSMICPRCLYLLKRA